MAASLDTTLTKRFSGLAPKQQAVAQVLAQDKELVAFSSAAQIAARAKVDTATVVRTCQRLGYTGWRDLQQEVQETLSHRRTFVERVTSLKERDDDLLTQLFDTAGNNIANTFYDLDVTTLDTVGRQISRANTVVVTAAGVLASAGLFLSSALQLVGVPATLVIGVGDGAPALSALRKDDVVVGISVWRYLGGTIRTLEHAARQTKAHVVAITDSAVSPAAAVADHTLIVHTASVGPRLGLTGAMVLIEAVVAAVALQDSARSRAAGEVANSLLLDDIVGSAEPPPATAPPPTTSPDRTRSRRSLPATADKPGHGRRTVRRPGGTSEGSAR